MPRKKKWKNQSDLEKAVTISKATAKGAVVAGKVGWAGTKLAGRGLRATGRVAKAGFWKVSHAACDVEEAITRGVRR